ncbi:putative FKBP-type 25 kDa peptidyl-prolyl cis-trans isomerase [Pseudomonas solani]|uniref:Peptidyl-prolyl cis-trans isomerase n=1 Tax=Pseudomonas solani TaxID=2731552 RepID=A0ABN6BTI9_9PSED|nr:FKBP-type peptidyl-prolyl cis-trans isomerase [Pseudomonas solani]MDN4143669.1 FKBP-type peptidyl-prolyl cis-trans isomerase [Pseudomonas tohonis]BCD85839.1 putative FKBP-type 25 kDa peptidyl-prolyl cis-trans isomerase [Pseudomonas solani]
MRAVVSLCLCLLALTAQAADEEKDLAYSMGVKLGERLREEAPQLQLESLLRGLTQAYRGEKLELDAQRMEHLLDAHEASMEQSGQAPQKAIAAEKRFIALERGKYGVRELTDGVLVSELRAGSGAKPGAHSQVRVNYRGQLADGSVFDASDKPQWFRLDSVIAGWRSALQEMPVGAKWHLVIPSSQAYGEEGAGDLIPPYAPLVFDLELLEVR